MHLTLRIAFIAVFAVLQLELWALSPQADTAGLRARPSSVKFTPHQFKANNGTVVEAELGEFQVPENRTKKDSRPLNIRFIRFKSTAAKPGNPIVYLAGGPGGSGIGAATSSTRFPLFMAMREFGDVIAYDQRGTNQSDPQTRCTEEYLVAAGEPFDRARAGAAVADAVRRCAQRLSDVDVTALNTREGAADLNDLRLALGAPKLILWGISYGTHLSIATLRYHPEAVERVILAGIEGPDDTYKLPSDQETLMEEIARLANHDGKSRDLLASINALLRELQARPKTVSLTHPLTGHAIAMTVGKLDLQRVLANMLVGPDTFRGMPEFVARLEQGDWLSLALAVAPERFGSAPSLMSVAMDCASGISAARRQRIASEAQWTLLGDAINQPFPEICAGLDVPDAGEPFRAALHSDVPALLISGTLDGRTRPRQAEELRRTMPNAEHLVIEGAGHSDPLFVSSPKILESMKAFLRGEPLRERYITLPPVTFQALRPIANVPSDVLARYAGTYRLPSTRLKIVNAGGLLYAIQEGRSPVALRPLSATEFFADSLSETFHFEEHALRFGEHRAVKE
jgi:pimeloyl-ACP methyl ester carboxylesterase